MVARFKPRHTFANFNNDSGAFVATDDWHFGGCSSQIAGHEVFIGMAHSLGGKLHENLAGFWWI